VLKQVRRSAIGFAAAAALLGAAAGAHAAPPPWAKGPSEKPCTAGDVHVNHQGLSCRVAGGLWKVKLKNGNSVLTHGPDTDNPLPAGTSTAASVQGRSPVCAVNNPHGNYYMVAIVAWPYDVTRTETDAAYRQLLQGVDGLFYSDAVASGSPQGADYVYACDSVGQIRVDDVVLPTPAASADFSTIVADLQAKGYNKPNEKYEVWYDVASPVYCGEGTMYFDETDGSSNWNNIGPDYAVAYRCNSLMHENGHNLGAVQYNAPYATGNGGHCWQEYDIMCYADGGDRYPGYLTYTCTDANHFDCAHNDYFDAKIGAGEGGGPGSYLDTHWNIGECYVRFVVNYSCPGTTPPPAAPPTGAGYRGAVLASAPAAYWRLGESGGTAAADDSGQARAGTYLNGVALGQSGALGTDTNTAASFDGANDAVAVPNLNLTGPFTLELWLYLRGPGSTGATDYSTLLGYDYTHRILWNSGTRQLLAQFDGNFWSMTTVFPNAWHHIAYTFDGSTERFYVDGQPAGSHATTRPTWNAPFRLGDYDGSNYLLNGKLDDVAVYGRALPASELQSHVTAAGYRASVMSHAPLAYWRLGESSGQVAVDGSGHGISALYTGGVTLAQAGALSVDPNPAASFDGVDDAVSAPGLNLAGPFTLELWAYLRGPGSTGATNYDTLLGYDYSHRLLWNAPSGKLLTQFDGNFVSTLAVGAAAWHQIVYSFDGGTERFYVDGQPAGSHATTKPVWTQPFRLGSYDNANYMLNGSLDEVAVYARALSASEVAADYAAR
jgi:Concanavalin A-like lectin/glucanases superfamily